MLMAERIERRRRLRPDVVTTRPMAPEELKGKRVAIPGKMTTAYLALRPVRTRLRARGRAVRQNLWRR